MTFDFERALKCVNAAIGHILRPGPFGAGIQNAISEVASPELMSLPSPETRKAFDHIFAAAKPLKSRVLSEEESEEIARLIFALRTRLELEEKSACDQSISRELTRAGL